MEVGGPIPPGPTTPMTKRTTYKNRPTIVTLFFFVTIVTLTPYQVSEVQGKDRVETLVLFHVDSGEQMSVSVDMIFPCLGFESKAGFLGTLIAVDDEKRIIVAADGSTNVPGVFAAGDSTTAPYQQIVISAGDGAKAALSTYHFIQKKSGKRALRVDWGFNK